MEKTAIRVLVIGAGVSYPTRNGPSQHMDQRYRALSRLVDAVDMVTRNTFIQYRNGVNVFEETLPPPKFPHRWLFGIRTLLNQSDYLWEMLFRDGVVERYNQFAANPTYNVVVVGPIQGLGLLNKSNSLQQAGRLLIIDTYDDMYAWYQKVLRRFNPVMRLVASVSLRWLNETIRKHQKAGVFFHISENDKNSYESRFPGMIENSYLLPLGTHQREAKASQVSAEKIRLLFIGGLNVQINMDAVTHFGEKYFPALKQEFGSRLEVIIAGRGPSRKMIQYCRKMGWILRPDLETAEVDDLYHSVTFSLLPFEYMWGAKNKLLESLAYGVPFLATRLLLPQVPDPEEIHPCLFSDSPDEWVERVKNFYTPQQLDSTRARLVEYSSRHSWENKAELVLALIQKHMPEQEDTASGIADKH